MGGAFRVKMGVEELDLVTLTNSLTAGSARPVMATAGRITIASKLRLDQMQLFKGQAGSRAAPTSIEQPGKK